MPPRSGKVLVLLAFATVIDLAVASPALAANPTFRDLVDSITGPAQQLLQSGIDRINSIPLVAARGLNLDYFLGPISMLGPAWVGLVKTVIGSIILIATVFFIRALYNLYLAFKQGIKWW